MLAITYLFAASIVSFLIALYLGPILMSVAVKLDFLDKPDGNLKKHAASVPYLGGLVVYLSMLISLIFFFPFKSASIFFILGLTLLLLLGLIDDVMPLKPSQKFFGQLIATICFIKGGFFLKEVFLSSQSNPIMYGIWMVISVFWILSVINAFNLVDVMDGLASTIAFMASFSFLVVACIVQAWPASIVLAAFMGALAGFLRYNAPPAQMYLGDAGSLFIGGVMAIVPFMIPWGNFSWYGYLAPPLILGIVLIEGVTLITIRSFLRIPFYAGSPHHFCHFLKSRGWSVRMILLYVVVVSLTLLMVSLLYLLGAISLLTLVLLLLVGICLWYAFLFFTPKRLY
jgi:UDP-GlcNAc:undecaprenyl-phosphate GlcNAc-1-phosphate transferase